MNNINDTFVFRLVSVLLIIIGVFMIFGSNKFRKSNKEFVENAFSTQAEVINVEDERNTDGNLIRRVYVFYEIDGIEYNYKLNETDNSLSKGDYVTVYYQENAPDVVKVEKEGSKMAIIFILIGIVMILVAIWRLTLSSMRERHLTKGEKYMQK